VEGVFHDDDFVAVVLGAVSSHLTGELDGRLVGFGARVAKEGPLGEGALDQRFGQAHLLFDVVEVADVEQPGGLVGDGLYHPGVAVA
jgi:hypothetical protein